MVLKVQSIIDVSKQQRSLLDRCNDVAFLYTTKYSYSP